MANGGTLMSVNAQANLIGVAALLLTAALIYWKVNHLEVKFPITGGSCHEVVERVFAALASS
jgi:hypothetical protein